MTKVLACIAANASGFVTGPALVLMPSKHQYLTACKAYHAANEMGIRPGIQECLSLMRLINILEGLCDE